MYKTLDIVRTVPISGFQDKCMKIIDINERCKKFLRTNNIEIYFVRFKANFNVDVSIIRANHEVAIIDA